ncbi:MAG: hypothetical protein L6W00_11800 [Lentisphaeria bacterium]|nr:MAG: hypothetical protein L6W00_11800 [Lentisphaeria bacterium]
MGWAEEKNSAPPGADLCKFLQFAAGQPGAIEPERMHVLCHQLFERTRLNGVHEAGIALADGVVLVGGTQEDNRPVHQEGAPPGGAGDHVHPAPPLLQNAACGELRQPGADRSACDAEPFRQQILRRNFGIRRQFLFPDQLQHIPDHLLARRTCCAVCIIHVQLPMLILH